jgi:hypothetical protein
MTPSQEDAMGRLVALPQSDEVVSHFIHLECGNAFDLLASTAPMTAQLILTDPPYGITKAPWDTRLTVDEYDQLQRLFTKHLADSGTVLMFTDLERHSEVLSAMTAGDLKNHLSFVWVKTNAHTERSVFYRSLLFCPV